MRTRKKNSTHFEVRGVKNVVISRGLQFLDMLQQGHADFGKIRDVKAPEEFSETGTMAFWATLQVLNSFDPELRKSFSSNLSEKMSQEVSSWTKWFIRITLTGSFSLIAILLGAGLLGPFGIIPPAVLIPLMIVGYIVLFILVGLISLYAFMSQGKDPPQGVIDAISEPQVRFEAERAFEKILDVFQEESTESLWVLVAGEYDAFEYTGEVYRTSKDIELKRAILHPKSSEPWYE